MPGRQHKLNRRASAVGSNVEKAGRTEAGGAQAGAGRLPAGGDEPVRGHPGYSARKAADSARAQDGAMAPDGDGERPTRQKRRLAAARRAFRRATMIGPSDGDLEQMAEDDKRADTERTLGKTAKIVPEFTELGARRDDGMATATAHGEGNGERKPMPMGKGQRRAPQNPRASGSGQGSAARLGSTAHTFDREHGRHWRHDSRDGNDSPLAPREPTGWRSRLATAHRILRKVAMARLSDEEIERLHAEDTRANTESIQGGKYYIVHGFTEFGARRSEEDGN